MVLSDGTLEPKETFMACGYAGFINVQTLYMKQAAASSEASSSSNYISMASGGKLTAKQNCHLDVYCGNSNATGVHREYDLSTGQMVTLPYMGVALVLIYDA